MLQGMRRNWKASIQFEYNGRVIPLFSGGQLKVWLLITISFLYLTPNSS